MKNLWLGLSLLIVFVAVSCQNASIYPPSPYIGIIDSYNGYKNGFLPRAEERFTGYWTNPGHIEGFYLDGKPIGIWRLFRPSGFLDRLAWYDQDGKYQEISYYPDGMTQSVEYFDGNTSKYSFFRPDGTMFPGQSFGNASVSSSGWYWGQFLTSSPFLLSDYYPELNLAAYFYFIAKNDNSFEGWYYICPGRDSEYGDRIGKLQILGNLNPETGEVENITTQSWLGGKYEVTTCSSLGDDNILRMEFRISSDAGCFEVVINTSLIRCDWPSTRISGSCGGWILPMENEECKYKL